jgi:hypothetical protein
MPKTSRTSRVTSARRRTEGSSCSRGCSATGPTRSPGRACCTSPPESARRALMDEVIAWLDANKPPEARRVRVEAVVGGDPA